MEVFLLNSKKEITRLINEMRDQNYKLCVTSFVFNSKAKTHLNEKRIMYNIELRKRYYIFTIKRHNNYFSPI